MAILPKERPDKSKKEKLENLEIASPFLEKKSITWAKKEFNRQHRSKLLKHMITESDTAKLIKKLKGSYSGMKHVTKKIYKNLTSKPNYKD